MSTVLLSTLLAVSPQPSLDVQDCPGAQLELPTDTEGALDSTLLLETEEGTGSAVLVSPDGFALTAAHVVAGERDVRAVQHDGTEVRAEVLRIDTAADVALLRIASSNPTSCLPVAAATLPLGSDVFVLGNPGGSTLSFSVSKGIVSGYRDFENHRYVQVDASVNPGNSGGPLVSRDGSLLGVMSWKFSGVALEGLSFAAPADAALATLGVRLGVSTDPRWDEVHVPPPPASARVDTEATTSVPEIRRGRLRAGLTTGGAVALTAGVISITTTAVLHRRWRQMSRRDWAQLRGWNTAGWVSASIGASLIAVGLVLPKSPRRELELRASSRGVQLRGRF